MMDQATLQAKIRELDDLYGTEGARRAAANAGAPFPPKPLELMSDTELLKANGTNGAAWRELASRHVGQYWCGSCRRWFNEPLPLPSYCGCRGWE